MSDIALDLGKRIHTIRGQRVMLDADLAGLYDVATKTINRAVARNATRFPVDFMFHLTPDEARSLRYQIGTSKRGGRRYRPYAFTEQGIAMLSSVLRSERAALVNIAIMRAFVRLRQAFIDQGALSQALEELESRVSGHDASIRTLFTAIRRLASPPPKETPEIGFRP